MLKFLLLSLLAASCSGVPVDVPGTEEAHEDNPVDSEYNENTFQQYKAEVQQTVGKLPFQKSFEEYKDEDVKFYLYTRQVPSKHQLFIYNQQTLHNSSYNPRKAVKVIIPTWMYTEEHYNELVSAYLRNHEQYLNVITVDYNLYASIDFHQVPHLMEQVGKTLEKLVRMLYEYGSHPNNIHMVGHGFGAHAAGAAAKFLFPLKVGRITGLDPIGMMYHQNRSLLRFEKNDADFTDSIMTTIKGFGSGKPCSHVRFYPNGGMNQPMPPSGSNTPGYTMKISHFKAFYYFVESVVRPTAFPSKKAKSYGDYLRGNTLPDVAYMGEYVSKGARGNFYLETNPLPPYSRSIVSPLPKDEPVDQSPQQASDEGDSEIIKAIRKPRQ